MSPHTRVAPPWVAPPRVALPRVALLGGDVAGAASLGGGATEVALSGVAPQAGWHHLGGGWYRR